MELWLYFHQSDTGFVATIEQLPGFQLAGPTKIDVMTATPTALHQFVAEWEAQHNQPLPQQSNKNAYIQRVKARGFYQSTVHRMVEYLTLTDASQLDLELIHCFQGKDFRQYLAQATSAV